MFTRDEVELGKKLLEFFANDPKRWTQGYFAKTSTGTRAFWDAPEAVCWCVKGAVFKMGYDSCAPLEDAAAKALGVGLDKRSDFSVARWQDQLTRTFHEVRDLLESIANGYVSE